MKFLIVLTALLVPTLSFAGDSSWLLCKGQMNIDGDKFNIVINSVEHRDGVDDEGNDKRVNDLTLIFGNRLMVGQLDTTNGMNGTVLLATADGASKFDGNVTFEYSKPSMAIRGKVVIDEELSSTITSKLTCENMN